MYGNFLFHTTMYSGTNQYKKWRSFSGLLFHWVVKTMKLILTCWVEVINLNVHLSPFGTENVTLYSSSSWILSALLTSLPLLSLLRKGELPQRSQTSGAQRWGEAALPCPQAVLLPCPQGTPAASVNTVSEWRQASSDLYKHRTAASCNASSTESFFSSQIQLFSLNQFWRSYIKELFHALICTLLFVSDFLPDKWFARTENSHFLL